MLLSGHNKKTNHRMKSQHVYLIEHEQPIFGFEQMDIIYRTVKPLLVPTTMGQRGSTGD